MSGSTSNRLSPFELPAAYRREGVRGESGFTIFEVLVAILVLTVGMVALVQAFDSSQRIGTSAEAHQTALAFADQELERVRAQTWKKIALQEGTSVPTQTSTTNTNDPTYYMASSTTTCAGQGPSTATKNCYQTNWGSSSTTTLEPFVIEKSPNGDSTANPKEVTTTVTAGGTTTRLKFKLYRFITWVNDGSGTNTCPSTRSTCSGENDSKRVLIAVTGTDLTTPVVTLTGIVNNTALEVNNPLTYGVYCKDGTEEVSCTSQS